MKVTPLIKRVYGDIIRGYSIGKIFNSDCVIKHFTPKDQAEIDGHYIEFYEFALKEGVSSEDEKLKSLIKEGLWDKEKENKILDLKSELSRLNETKSQLVFESQLGTIKESIERTRAKLNSLLSDKFSLIGNTAEYYANKKTNELYIYYSFYDKSNNRLFSKEEFDDLDEHQIDEITQYYNSLINNFEDKNLKLAALIPTYQNYLSLCGDNISTFFAKPIVDLSFYQCELLSYGRFFKHILSGENKPPSNILDDPDAMIDWYNKSRNLEKITGGDKSMGIVGGPQEEIQSITGQEAFDLKTEIAKTGAKTVRGENLAKMLGM